MKIGQYESANMKMVIQHSVLTFLLVVLMLVGAKTYVGAIEYENQMTQYSQSQNIKDLTKTNIKNKFGWVSWFKKEENGTKEPKEVQVAAGENVVPEQTYAYVSVLSTIVMLVLLSYFFVSLKVFNVYASLMTIIVLCYGLVTPIMMVTIHKKISYIGDVVLSFESKSLITSVVKLFEGGDYVIALVIVLFSVLVPVLKVLSLFLISVFEDTLFTHKLIGFFKAIGKWSMVDVFVVAVLLVFLSANKGDISKAEVEVGIYVFICYVIASMFVSVTASKMLKRIKYAN